MCLKYTNLYGLVFLSISITFSNVLFVEVLQHVQTTFVCTNKGIKNGDLNHISLMEVKCVLLYALIKESRMVI